jgi:putative cell wall-binding protein/Ca2+-binding RTX toxin-like protein
VDATRVIGVSVRPGAAARWRISAALAAVMALVITLLLAPPPPGAQAATDEDPSFVLTQNDLEFILRQIQISEAHAADELNPSNYELYCPGQGTAAQNCVPDVMRPAGVRTVDGSYNNLVAQRGEYGASDNAFPRLLPAEWRQAEPEALDLGFKPNAEEGPAGPNGEPGEAPADMSMCDSGMTCYGQTQGNVYDSHPREISNLIVDQTTGNPAIVNQLEAGTAIPVPGTDRVTIPNTAPDEELSAPFNTFMGFFGQFFDHGLDLVDKGGNGTLIVPLAADDPLYCVVDESPEGNDLGGVRANDDGDTEVHCDPDANYITLSRATRIDNTSTEHANLTSPFIDQNQTYSSHPAHQVFLREYELVDGVPQPTGKLIEGAEGGMATWLDVKTQAVSVLGLELTDADLLDVPHVVVDPYGNFVRGGSGFPMYLIVNESGATDTLEGSIGGTPIPDGWSKVGTGHAFLDDIAHGSTPAVDPATGELLPRFNEDGTPILGPDGQPVLTGYDNATLNAHYMAGDGRVNENIGLTAVHAVFHAEHNRMVGQILDVLNGERQDLEAQDSAERGGIAEFAKAFRGENHAYASDRPEDQLPGYVPAGSGAEPVAGQADDWTFEERLFQAAKFATEMQYQHLVFEEFGRKLAPTIDAVVFNENSYNADINAAITAEFAHVVYRFGHSMMTEEIGREPLREGGSGLIEADGAGDVPLLTGFLNPEAYDMNGALSPEEAAGTLVNGMTSRVGSQIDEHVVDVLRNNLLGLPLDLPTLNLLRGRDAGVPSLQTARETFYAATGDDDLAPYTSWNDFGLNTKNGNNFGRAGERASLVNFVAAYGTHPTLEAATTLEEKRNAAALLVNGAPLGDEFVIRLAGPDRYQTARAIAERHFQPGVPVAYIAPGNNFPDALAGGALAALGGGPILLSGPNDTGEIPLATALALAHLEPQRIVVLGGPAVVGPNTVAALNSISDADEPVTRIAGADRFETAAEIARELEPGGRVFIADGMNFPDALAGAAVAAADGSAVLLVTPTSIPAATDEVLGELNPSEIVILGQTGAVSASVASQLQAYTEGDVIRLGGSNRYATAMEITQHFFPDGAETLYLATGANFPDALTSTPGAGINNAPLLLVPPTGLTPELIAEIERIAPQQIRILGGAGAVSTDVELALADLAPEPLQAPEDRLDFMNSTGTWAGVETGLNNVDFWVGGLAERLNPFGGMLGSTFNFVFETQLEKLQFGDRFYYLFRNQGEQLFAALEGNTFSDIIQRNTDASNLPADIFALHDPILDVDDYAGGAALPEGLILEGDGTYRWSGDEHVELHGSDAADRLRGDEGDDAIWGYAEDDRIEGGSGNDALVGGSGDDIITDSFGDDNLKGKQGNDAMHNGPGDDLSIGGAGDDFMVNGGGDATTLFAGLGDDIALGTSGRTTVFGGEHDDWVEGSSHADLLQGDNADQAQNDTLGGNDVVIGRFGNDDIEGEGGDDIIVGTSVGTDRHLGNLGFDWLTYYGSPTGVVSDWAFNRVFETQNQLASRFDLLEALSGSARDDTLRGPLVEPDDFTTLSEAPLNKATEASLDLIPGFESMLRPTATNPAGDLVALGDFAVPILRDAPEIDADGVHKVMIGGPGSDTIEGRGGNDYLDGDAMLKVQLAVGDERFDSASGPLQARVFSGEINPGDIDIVREIVDESAPTDIDTVQYADVRAAYEISEIGFEGSGYWTVTHTAVQEAEESDGTDVIHGFERMQFADGCAELTENAEGVLDWVSCEASAFVQMTPMEPVEGQPVTATLWQDAEFEQDFDENAVTNLLYTWWAGEGDTADTVGEWEVLATSPNPSYTPDQSAVGQFLRVTVGYTDPTDGLFRAARSAVSTTPVADVAQNGSLTLGSEAPFLVGVPIIAGFPSDPDGLFEEGALTYQWAWTTDDPTSAEAAWTDIAADAGGTVSAYAPTAADVGRTIRVTIGYTDGAETAQTVSAYTSVPVTGEPVAP